MRATPLILSLVAGCGPLAWAAENAPSRASSSPRARPAETVPAIFAPKALPSPNKAPALKGPVSGQGAAPSSAPRPRRAVSPEMAAKLLAATSAIQTATASRAQGVAGAPTGRIDPESGALVLEPFVVREETALDERSMQALTKKLDPKMREMTADALEQLRRKEMGELSDLIQIGERLPSEMQRTIDAGRIRINEKVYEEGTPFREPIFP